MALPDGDSHGYAGFLPHVQQDEHDNWPDAPAERAAADGEAAADEAADDEFHSHFQRTMGTPSYDLGPTTGSFVVDLTTPQPVAAQAAAQAAAQPSAKPADGAAAGEGRPEEHGELLGAPRHAAPQVPARDPHLPAVPAAPVLSGAESLTAASVLRTRRARPQSGWRKGVFAISGGRVNLGLSPADVHRAELLARARTAVSGCHRLAVISLKGGVGKTTTTAALGAMFADLRGDRVIAVDANPDRGTLAERVPRENGASVRHLLDARDHLHRYADVREFTSQSPTRLEVLASDSDPRVSAALSEQDYRDTITTLERFYNLVLTDCGTGLLHDAMRGILGLASSLVVVSSASLDGARSASATLDWLEAHGFDELAKSAVVVISSVRPGGGIVDVSQLEEHFAARCRDVVTVPYDPHLEAGGVLDLADLDAATLDAYRELAAVVGEGFSRGGTPGQASTAWRSASSRS